MEIVSKLVEVGRGVWTGIVGMVVGVVEVGVGVGVATEVGTWAEPEAWQPYRLFNLARVDFPT